MRDLSGNVGVRGESGGVGANRGQGGPGGSWGLSCLGLICAVLGAQTFINIWGDPFDAAVSISPPSHLHLNGLICWISDFSFASVCLAWGVSLARLWLLWYIPTLMGREGNLHCFCAMSVCGVCVWLQKPLDFLCFSFIKFLFWQECVPAVVSGGKVWNFSRGLLVSWRFICEFISIWRHVMSSNNVRRQYYGYSFWCAGLSYMGWDKSWIKTSLRHGVVASKFPQRNAGSPHSQRVITQPRVAQGMLLGSVLQLALSRTCPLQMNAAFYSPRLSQWSS